MSSILLGELFVIVLLSVPMGLPMGRFFAVAMMSSVDVEQVRFPVVISLRTYAYAVSVVVASALASALFVRRKLDALDLVGVLKTRE